MWYLIIPPLVFLGSLWLLLLFLSRRVTDPSVAEKISNHSAEKGQYIHYLKEEVGLRILEKVNQRFKVFFLKLHNASGTLSQSLKARRERFRAKREVVKVSSVSPLVASSQSKKSFWMRFRGQEESGVVIGEAGVREDEQRMDTGELGHVSTGPTSPTSSTQENQSWQREHSGDSVHEKKSALSFNTRRQETREKSKRLVSEEDLIGKIAKNPKDAVAYEELGDYYLETKQLEDAKACYRQVIKLLPMNREVKEKVRRLERLLTRAGR